MNVNESHRTMHQDRTLKSPDFIVAAPDGGFLLIEVKGRLLPRPGTTKQSWVTRDDIASMLTWEEKFTPSRALLAFVYQLADDAMMGQFTDHFIHRDRAYGCLTIRAGEYAERMRQRSPRWQTVHLLKADYEKIAHPLSYWIDPSRAGADTKTPPPPMKTER